MKFAKQSLLCEDQPYFGVFKHELQAIRRM